MLLVRLLHLALVQMVCGSISDLSATCTATDRPCKTHANTLCDDNTGECQCQPGYTFSDSSIGCVPAHVEEVPHKLGSKCSSPNECPSVDGSLTCNPDGICACSPYYQAKYDRCEPILGSLCEEIDKICSGLPNSKCRNGQCICKKGYIAELNGCKEITESGLESKCKNSHTPCGGVPNSGCQNRTCLCLDGYIAINGRCFPGVNKPCSQAFACGQVNTVCTAKGICECKAGLVAKGHVCAPGVGAYCYKDQECLAIPHSFCSAKSLCVCKAEFVESQGTCVKENLVGSHCDHQTFCSSPGSVCVGGMCECSGGLIPKFGLCFAGLGSRCQLNGLDSNLICGDVGVFCTEGICSRGPSIW